MKKFLFDFGLILVLILGFSANLWAGERKTPFLPKQNELNNSFLLQKELRTTSSPELWFSKNTGGLRKSATGTGAISGRVTSAAGGSPVSDVVITASQMTCPYDSYLDTTDAGGYYVIHSLPCGKYSIHTSNDSHFVDIYWNNKPNAETADTVAVASHDTTEDINFSLRVGGKITGTVTLQGALFVLATFVAAVDTTARTLYYVPISSLGSTATYTIKRLPTGTYKLRTFNLLGYIDVYYNNKTSWVTADPVSVTEGSTTSSKNFTLSRGGTIQGTIASAKGPLDSILVLGLLVSDTLEWIQLDYSNASGDYSLTGLRSGDWKVFALGDTTYAFEWYDNQDNLSSANPISVTAPNTVSGKNFSLELGGSIAGYVHDSQGSPFTACEVAAFETSTVQVGIPLKGGSTSSDGSYMITGLRTGGYKVEGSSKCDEQWYDHQTSLDSANVVFVTMPGEVSGIDFDLPSMFVRGDVNGDGVIDVGDVVYLVNYLFKDGPTPLPLLEAGNVSCDGVVDIGDVVFLINYLFKDGQEPCC